MIPASSNNKSCREIDKHPIVCILYNKMQFLLVNLTTLNHVWSIQLLIKETNQYGPQYAFKMSMFMCPAVHMSTRSLLRSSSTHKPSDPPLRVELKFFTILLITYSAFTCVKYDRGF